jgi:hypothetical protein
VTEAGRPETLFSKKVWEAWRKAGGRAALLKVCADAVEWSDGEGLEEARTWAASVSRAAFDVGDGVILFGEDEESVVRELEAVK